MCFIILPISLIYITISIDNPSFAVRFIFAPVAFVQREIIPNLLPLTMPFSIFKLPIISLPLFKGDWASLGKPLFLQLWVLAATQFGYYLSNCFVIKIFGLERVQDQLSWIFRILLIFYLLRRANFACSHFLYLKLIITDWRYETFQIRKTLLFLLLKLQAINWLYYLV